MTNFFARCGFSDFVGPQPESTTEFNEHFLPVENNDEFENTDENVPCFDEHEDVRDVIERNVKNENEKWIPLRKTKTTI